MARLELPQFVIYRVRGGGSCRNKDAALLRVRGSGQCCLQNGGPRQAYVYTPVTWGWGSGDGGEGAHQESMLQAYITFEKSIELYGIVQSSVSDTNTLQFRASY